MHKLVANPADIEIKKPSRNHTGFCDAEGEVLQPGDIIAMVDYNSLHTCVITRFTPKTIFAMRLYCEEAVADRGGAKYEYRCQVGYYGQYDAEGRPRMAKVLKIKEMN